MRRFLVPLVAVFLCLIGASNTLAAESKYDFLSECPALFSQLDNFANECLVGAREEGDTFNDQLEVHGAFLGKAYPGSHFALGCTLNWKHQIDYIGIYYALNTTDFEQGNTAPLVYVDFFGNFGVNLNGEISNFILIRQFGNSFISPHFEHGVIKNCETPFLPNHNILSTFGGRFSASQHNMGKAIWIRGCIDTACRPDAPYTEFNSSSDKEIIYNGDYFTFLIESGGGILVRNEVLKSACPIYKLTAKQGTAQVNTSENLLKEICLSMK